MASKNGKINKNITVKVLREKVDNILKQPDSAPIEDDEVWAVVNSFMEHNGLNSAQLNSFNDFIHNKAQDVVDSPGIKTVTIEENGKKFILEFGELYFSSPTITELDGENRVLFPIESLWRNTSYVSEVHIDLTVTPPTGKQTHYDKEYLGNMPVMVKSDLCNFHTIADDEEQVGLHSEDFFDHGGYFVIAPKSESAAGTRAQRRALAAQEKITNNRIFVFKNRKNKPKFTTYAECHSTVNGTHTTAVTVGQIQKRISCVLPWIDKTEIPVGVVFRALGIDSEEMMATLILGPNFKNDAECMDIIKNILIYPLEESYECNTQEGALHFIGRRGRKFTKVNKPADDDGENAEEIEEDADTYDGENEGEDIESEADSQIRKDKESAISYAKHLMTTEVLSHLGQTEDAHHDKAVYFGYMIRKLVYVILGKLTVDNRDHYMNKRINTTGVLMAQQFHNALRRLITDISHNVLKALKQGHNVNIKSWIKPNIITNAMIGAISNNAWTMGGAKAKGISQIYEQFNYTGGISNLRKVKIFIDGDAGKIIVVRDVTTDQFGKMCPAESPEGKTAGLVRNMALSCYITVGTDAGPVKKIINHLLGNVPFPESLNWTRIFVNGVQVGATKTPRDFKRNMVKLKRNGTLSAETSIAYFERATTNISEIHISTEAGRPCRPLLVVENGELVIKSDTIENLVLHEMSWNELLCSGMVELVDAAEEEEAVVAGYPSDFDTMSNDLKLKYTHCELHPSMLYGVGGSIIPFPDHNQCIGENELVTMEGGTVKSLKNIKVGDRVVNFNPQTGAPGVTTVTNVLHKRTNKQMYRITTVNGRTVTATGDHRFIAFDDKGSKKWCKVANLKNGSLVGIYDSTTPLGADALLYSFIRDITAISDKMIADITTESPHQSFICNGFGVHNSPRNTYQCLWKEEPVLMADGTTKAIKDVKVGDEVVTFDPETLETSTTKVIHHHVAPTDKKILRLTTWSGRTITVTEDHKVFTIGGWVEAGNLKINDTKICIFENSTFYPPKSFYGYEFVRIRSCEFKPNLTIEEYERLVKFIVNDKGYHAFMPLGSIEVVDNVEIADITTESSNHSFIGGQGFCVHNSAMGKQAIGIPFSNYRQMNTGTFHVMRYLQRPLALSRAASIVRFDEMPAGQNAMTLIMPRKFNEEDSLELNADSIARGFMNSDKFTNYYAECREDRREFFGVPTDEECERFRGDASKLNEEGFAPRHTVVVNGDILIGKLAMIKVDAHATGAGGVRKKYINHSIKYEHMWPATVDSIQIGTTADGYKFISITLVQVRIPVVGDKFCYTPDHDVLTTDGWIPVANITRDHYIASLDTDGKLVYEQPTEVVSFDHDGDIIHVDTDQVDLKVTPNHNVYVRRRTGKFKLEPIEKLDNVHVHYKKDAIWETPLVKHFVLPSIWVPMGRSKATIICPVNLDMNEWLIFFGIWMAEGWTHGGRVEIAVNKERVLTALEKCLRVMGFGYKVFHDEFKLKIYDKQLVAYMSPLSVWAINKQLPEWVWSLSKEQCQILLHSMCLGDGHMNGNTPMYDTSSIKLKDDVIRLALHCGWAANAKIRSKAGTHKVIRGKDTVTNADAWRLTIIKTQLEPAVNKHIKNQQVAEHYVGKVYCFTVPSHIVYVRNSVSELNGLQRPVWCGQSARHGQKGTAGKIIPAIDLPFNSAGVPPDIVVNPIAFTSRMTIAMIIETWTGKVVTSTSPLHDIAISDYLLDTDIADETDDFFDQSFTSSRSEEFNKIFSHPQHPQLIDATPFRKNFSRDVIRTEMGKYGCDLGDEYFTDGITGKRTRCLAFFGPCYYQRLRHMVVDKIHARARGARTILFRQPMEGRVFGGGLRIGSTLLRTSQSVC